MHFLWIILIGFLVGLLAKWLHPGKDDMGFIVTVLLGIGGSLFATWAGQAIHFYQPGEGAGFLGAVVGAVLLLAIYGALVKKR